MPDSLSALRRANPRATPGFPESIERAAHAVSMQITREERAPAASGLPAQRSRRLPGISAASASLAVAVALAAFVAAGSLTRGPGVESAAAAFQKAATLTVASAERSGTAEVRITRGGDVWAGKTIRWAGDNVAVSRETVQRSARPGGELLVVDGVLYGIEPEYGGWVSMGSPKNIDPDSGTTPEEYLTAVRKDVGGATVRRITSAMNGLTQRELSDGSTVYSGTVRAGLIARETGFKEGQAIRVLPFGYVAHDEAADPATTLETTVTVGADGVVREIAVVWGGSASRWTYTVSYSSLGSTPALVAPANAKSLRELRGIGG